jgi:predicted nucleotidyltransferase
MLNSALKAMPNNLDLRCLLNNMKTIDDVQLKNRDQEAVETACKLLKERFPVDEVILFGSKARGEDDPESDIDILVLTSRPITWRERKAITYALFEVEMTYEVVISTLIAASSDWEEGTFSVLPIHGEIAHDGIVI